MLRAMNEIQTISSADPIYRKIHGILEQKILGNEIEAGTVILEGPIAEFFGVSRAPVKTALSHLIGQGLVKRFEGRGYLVTGGLLTPVERGRTFDPTLLKSGASVRAELKTPAAWERIYDEVERELASHSPFGPQRIVENDLAQHFGVSRTVAHDVLTRLQNLGITGKDRQSRWFVVPLTVERVRHLYEVRRILEPAALAKAADMIQRETLEEMAERLDATWAAYPDVSIRQLDRLERDLHIDCISHCDNRELLDLLKRTQALLISNKYVLGGHIDLPGTDPFMGEHRLVLQALLDGKPARAAALLRRHLDLSVTKIVRRLEILQSSEPPPLPSYMSAM
jgi:DNA-binding GntR family transcriptional regulator